MNTTFKQNTFDHEKLKQFGKELIQNGIPVTIIWKKGKKTQEENDPKTNTFVIEKEGTVIFRQLAKSGFVKLDKLSEEEQNLILPLLKKYEFYTQPNWPLGIGLFILFLIIEFFVVVTRHVFWIQVTLLIGSLMMTLGFVASYLYVKENRTKSTYNIIWVIWGIGYISTVPLSLLAVPLLKSILYFPLYKLVEELPNELQIETAS